MKRWMIVGLAVLGFLTGVGSADGAILYGVTGDGANASPESFFTVSTVDASVTFVQALGNGNDGESIAFNPNDGLMYHWSGFDSPVSQIMETINLNNQAVTNVPQNFGAYDPAEVFGSTFDPTSGNFLLTDINDNLSSVTPGGVWSNIGNPSGTDRGLGFVGADLYAGDRGGNALDKINPLTGGTISSVGVTLAGFTVNGINGLSTDPDSGILYAILKTASGPSGRHLVTLNPTTGVATDIGVLPHGFANIEFGAGSTVIPEPSTFIVWSLLGVFGMGAGWYRRRRVA